MLKFLADDQREVLGNIVKSELGRKWFEAAIIVAAKGKCNEYAFDFMKATF